MCLKLISFDNQYRIRPPEAEGVAQHGVDFRLYCMGSDIELLRMFIGFLEIDVGCYEVVLHHQRAVHNL